MKFDYYQAKVVATMFHAKSRQYCAGTSSEKGLFRRALNLCVEKRATRMHGQRELPGQREGMETMPLTTDVLTSFRVKFEISKWRRVQAAWLLLMVLFLQHFCVRLGVDAIGVSQL